MVVSVLLAVLMFHGCVQMKERCCKYSCQEGPTEYCRYRANSSHQYGMLWPRIPGVNEQRILPRATS